jgi:hypothetical protein
MSSKFSYFYLFLLLFGACFKSKTIKHEEISLIANSESIFVTNIYTKVFEQYHIPVITTKFKIVNNSNENILIYCHPIPSNISTARLKLYNTIYGTNKNLYINEDIGFNFKYKKKWKNENEIPLINRSLESYFLIYPKDTIIMFGTFLNGFAKIMDKQRVNVNSPFIEDVKAIDSISFVLRYYTTDYQLKEINILEIANSDKFKLFEKKVYSKVNEYDTNIELYNLIDSLIKNDGEVYEMKIITSK